MKHRKNKSLCTVSWVLVLIASVVSILLISSKQVFTGVMSIVVYAVLLALAVLMLVLTMLSKKNTVCILNVALAAVVSIAGVLAPDNAAKKIELTEPSRVGERNVNFYVLNEDYRTAHSDDFGFTKPSVNIVDYADKTFIVQTSMNQADQQEAMTSLATALDKNVSDIKTVSCATVQEAVEAMYNNDGDVLVLNEAFISQLEKYDAYTTLSSDTFVLYTAVIGQAAVTAEPTADPEGVAPFVAYVAGNDTRDDGLTLYGRTDVDMIMAVNPGKKQILLVSIPRDFYIANPALDNGLDKLTHLGNDGIQNTLDGINQAFGLDIQEYLTTNFTHFSAMVDEIGGIDIDNPYAFEGQNSGNYDFAEGPLHLDGAQALAYARERYSLSNGDYGRNAHQGIVMEGILTKVQQMTNNGQYVEVISALTKNFLTNINVNDIYGMLKGKSEGDWQFIKYHLGGNGTYDGTASMGWDRQLYVCKPFDSQLQFTAEQVNKVLNGEEITQQDLPDSALTTFEEN